MMENREYLNRLFDIYENLLTEIEQLTFINYYKEDLSLTEIANLRNISKSSVSKTLKQVEEKLNDYESILNIYSNTEKLKEALELNDITSIKEKIEEILN